MLNLNSVEIIWDSSEVFINDFGKPYQSNNHDPEQQNLNIIVTRKKASLDEVVNGLIGIMGLGVAIQDSPWYKLMVGVFAIAVVSPISLKIFTHPSVKDILELIDSEYGDQYLDSKKLSKIYKNKPETEEIVKSFIRNKFLEKEEDGRFYFSSKVIKDFEINFF